MAVQLRHAAAGRRTEKGSAARPTCCGGISRFAHEARFGAVTYRGDEMTKHFRWLYFLCCFGLMGQSFLTPTVPVLVVTILMGAVVAWGCFSMLKKARESRSPRVK